MIANNHPIAATRSRQGRAIGLSLAILLNVAFVTALVIGLRVTNVIKDLGPIHFIPIKSVIGHPPPPPGPIKPIELTGPKPVQPIVVIEGEGNGEHAITNGPSLGDDQQIASTPAAGIAETHTRPPYPPVALRLGETGSVRLHITISPEGRVTAVSVVRSSGSGELDLAASEWVKAHWRYRPATRGGAAVESSAEAEVLFDLKNAQ